MKHPDDEALWSFLDGCLRPREHAILSKRIIEEEDLRSRFDELRRMHELIKQTLPPMIVDQSVSKVVDSVMLKLKKQNKPNT